MDAWWARTTTGTISKSYSVLSINFVLMHPFEMVDTCGLEPRTSRCKRDVIPNFTTGPLERPAKSLLAQTCCKTALGLISQFIVRQAGQMHAHNMHRRLATALSLLCAWSTTRYPSATSLLFHCQSLVRCAHATVINCHFQRSNASLKNIPYPFNDTYCIKSWCIVNQNLLNNFVNTTSIDHREI